MNAGRFPHRLLTAWTVMVLLFMQLPLLLMALVSLTASNYNTLPTRGFSLRWYRQILEHPEFLSASINSVVLAVAATLTALVIGGLAALAVVRHDFFLRGFVRGSVTSPLFVPMVMSGLAILIYFSTRGWSNVPLRLYIGHCAIALPYVFRVLASSLSSFDVNQELAARNLGASPLRAFMLVTLPQLKPGIFAGTAFAFIISFDNVGISVFLTGPGTVTLPIQLFSYMSYEYDPMAAAVSVLMILFSLAMIAILERLVGLQQVFK